MQSAVAMWLADLLFVFISSWIDVLNKVTLWLLIFCLHNFEGDGPLEACSPQSCHVSLMRRRLAGSLWEPPLSVLVPVCTCHQQTKLDRHWNRATRRYEPTLSVALWSAPTVSLVSVEITLFWELRRRLGRTVAFNKGSIRLDVCSESPPFLTLHS